VRQQGVSLIELVAVIVALAAGMALLGTAYVQPARSITDNANIQTAWRVAHACADQTLGRVRAPGQFSNLPVGTSTLTFGGTSCTITAGPDVANCLGTAFTCRPVNISATTGGYTAALNFDLFNY
jgi:Tfp pilus assembly protein PilV